MSDPWILVGAMAVFGCLADSHRPSAPVLAVQLAVAWLVPGLAVQLSPMRAHLHLLL